MILSSFNWFLIEFSFFFLSFPFWVIGLPEKKHINVNVCVWALSLWWNYQRRRRRRQLRQKSEKNVNWARKKNRKKSIDSSMKKKKKLLSLSFVYWVYEFCQIINSTHSSVFFFLGYSDKQIFIFFLTPPFSINSFCSIFFLFWFGFFISLAFFSLRVDFPYSRIYFFFRSKSGGYIAILRFWFIIIDRFEQSDGEWWLLFFSLHQNHHNHRIEMDEMNHFAFFSFFWILFFSHSKM